MNKLLIAGLMAAVAVPALAQVAPVAPVQPLRPMADKVMTRAEVQTMVQTHFARRDANKDGFITKDEMGVGRMAMGGQPGRNVIIRREGGMAGPDGNGMIRREAGPMGDPAAAFDRLDVNHDGAISRDEFAKGREMRIEKRIVMNGGPNGRGAPDGMRQMRMKHMGGMGGMMGGRMLVMSDINKDGRVSLQEAQTSALQHFDLADSNRDGRLTVDEMRAAHQKMTTMRHAG